MLRELRLRLESKGIETPHQFMDRVLSGTQEALAPEGELPLVVAHGGVCWALCNAMGIASFRAPNAKPIYFRWLEAQGWSYEILW